MGVHEAAGREVAQKGLRTCGSFSLLQRFLPAFSLPERLSYQGASGFIIRPEVIPRLWKGNRVMLTTKHWKRFRQWLREQVPSAWRVRRSNFRPLLEILEDRLSPAIGRAQRRPGGASRQDTERGGDHDRVLARKHQASVSKARMLRKRQRWPRPTVARCCRDQCSAGTGDSTSRKARSA